VLVASPADVKTLPRPEQAVNVRGVIGEHKATLRNDYPFCPNDLRHVKILWRGVPIHGS
jgi:hypothetical protein